MVLDQYSSRNLRRYVEAVNSAEEYEHVSGPCAWVILSDRLDLTWVYIYFPLFICFEHLQEGFPGKTD